METWSHERGENVGDDGGDGGKNAGDRGQNASGKNTGDWPLLRRLAGTKSDFASVYRRN